MTRNAPAGPVGQEPRTLSDADITSQRTVTRRSLLGVLGVSAGVAAAMAFGTAEGVAAADADKSKDAKPSKKRKKTPPKEEADSD